MGGKKPLHFRQGGYSPHTYFEVHAIGIILGSSSVEEPRQSDIEEPRQSDGFKRKSTASTAL